MAFNIVAAIGLVISMLFIAALMPTIISATGMISSASAGSPVTQAVAWLIPLAVLLAIFMGIFAAAQPTQQVEAGF